VTAFRRLVGREPDGVWSAPGRVNLIGEHTDYNDGFVLPVAIDLECRAAVARREDGLIRCWSVQLGQGASASVADLTGQRVADWSAYVLGVAWALREAGVPVPGADVVVDSAVPGGAGLSSSAALECSVGLALCDLAGIHIDPTVLALAGQRAETDVVGAPVGVMDQMASVHGRSGAAVFLDCRSMQVRAVPLPLEQLGLALVVVDTRVTHAHATGGYGARRRACEQAAQVLGVLALRDATLDQLEAAAARLGDERLRRARHVVTENERVLATVRALDAGDYAALGALMAESHTSLRDDFEVSVVELDTAVAAAVGAGAVGARMTGGGFGGSAVALVAKDRVPAVADAVRAAASAGGLRTPEVHVVTASAGARRLG
jgi:galactokinase